MNYLWLTLKHKWFVLLAGLKLGCPLWRLIVHDLSKFSPSELPHYQRQFFGKSNDPRGYVLCWTHHQNRNDHHWEYWVPRTGHSHCHPPFPDNVPLEMSYGARIEMIADWMGASRAYEGRWPTPDNWQWREKQLPKILPKLHPDTARLVELTLQNWADKWPQGFGGRTT